MQTKFNTEKESAYGVFDVEPQEVFEKREQVEIIDVRGADEYHGELGHIEGSELITLDFLAEQLPALPKDKTYVFVCRSGGRSSRATAYAKSMGFDSVYNMRGGMLLWNELGLEIADT
jgi:rhodanese-related sulfurtransferase